MTTFRTAALLALAAATPALAQVSITSVNRSARLRCFVQAPPDTPLLGEEWSTSSQEPGHWHVDQPLSYAAAHPDPEGGSAMSNVHLNHNSEVHPDHFHADANLHLDVSSSGVCAAEGVLETATEIVFVAPTRLQMHAHVNIDNNGSNGHLGATLTLVNEFDETLIIISQFFDEVLVLDPGTYTFTISARGEGNCNGICTSNGHVHFNYDVNFQPAPPCPADFNGDTQVDFFDYLDFVQAFANEDPAADFNHDSQVDFFDYLDFIAAYDSGC